MVPRVPLGTARTLDGLLASALVLVTVGEELVRDVPWTRARALAVSLELAAAAALVWRRSRPVEVALLASATLAASAALTTGVQEAFAHALTVIIAT